MHSRVRTSAIALLVAAAAILLTLPLTMTSAVALAATLYLLKGTNSPFNQIPDSQYPGFADSYLGATGVANPSGPDNSPVLVDYPATFFPVTPPGYIFSPTYDESVAAGVASLKASRAVSSTSAGDVLWGYSQGAGVITQYKRDYNTAYSDAGTTPPVAPAYEFVANPNRPNGGIQERAVILGTIPILGLTFDGATPTSTAGVPDGTITSYDVARQYDIIADAPENPLNLAADINGLIGYLLLHGKYPDADLSTAVDQGTFGDTQYYLIPTETLPVLMPLESVPLIGPLAADILDPPLRVIVEAGYHRTTSPGQPTPFNTFYFPDPVSFVGNLLVAVPTGLDNGFEDLGLGRPAGTTPVSSPFGVGGPPTNAGSQPVASASSAPSSDPPADPQESTDNADTAGTQSQNARPTSRRSAVPRSTAAREVPIDRGTIDGPPSPSHPDDVVGAVNGVVKQIESATGGSAASVSAAATSAGSGDSTSGGGTESGAASGSGTD